MRNSLVLACACVVLTLAMAEDEDVLDKEENMITSRETTNQTKADTLMLPSNATSIRENISDTFSCENRTYGYYADVDNECQIFHVCLPVSTPDGKNQTYRWSFICPEETVFNQEVFVCVRTEDSIECEDSPMLYYLNEEFGKEENKSANATTGERITVSKKKMKEEESNPEDKIGSMRRFLYKPLLDAVIASSESGTDDAVTKVEEDEGVIGEIESKTDSLSLLPDVNRWIIQDRSYLPKSGKGSSGWRKSRKVKTRGSIKFKDYLKN